MRKSLCVLVRFLFYFYLCYCGWAYAFMLIIQRPVSLACEWLCWLQLFLFFWILSNNGRLRAQTKVLCALAIGLVLWASLGPLWDRQLIGEEKSNLIEGEPLSSCSEFSKASFVCVECSVGCLCCIVCTSFLCVRFVAPLGIGCTHFVCLFSFILFYLLASHHVFWGLGNCLSRGCLLVISF